MRNSPAKSFSTAARSLARRRPLSTKIQVRRSPMALCKRAAATEESTPPLRPRITRPSPTCSWISRQVRSMKDSIVQLDLQPQIRCTKLARISPPRGVWTTSGWNCRPKMLRLVSPMTAWGEFSVLPSGRNPVGSLVILSPWLFHTSSVAGSLWKSAHLASPLSLPGPYSRSVERSTLPPRPWAMSCMP